jgi:hypothetical protein
VRNLEERFISRVLPLFKRQTKQVRDLIPELYLHGLASGDFELALRGLLGEGQGKGCPFGRDWGDEGWEQEDFSIGGWASGK